MEMGVEFLVGSIAGAVVAAIVAVIVAVGKNAMRKTNGSGQAVERRSPPASANDAAASAHSAAPAKAETSARMQAGKETPAQTGVSVRMSTGNTMIIGKVENQEKALSHNIQEVRDLLLKLADVISHTENASGEAAVAFNSARDTIHNLDSDQSIELADAQTILINEIDRVLTTNATLHSELERANKGIVEQRRQIEELRVQARVDGLTKIANRVAFDQRLAEFIGLLERANLVFSLLLLDIDFFKQVNDEHGHVNGDRILRGIAAKITGAIRNNDFAARYGGEEFAVVFPGTGLQEAVGVAERIRQDIAKTIFRMDDKSLKMTVSGGLAECRRGMTAEQIIAAADQALYQAKSEGRNRMLTAET